ncbi:phospholipase A1-Igamma1, chloroplastic-like [Aegilops tauschii subsp. strangulata]|uniref:phospholipase A1-Igamma1, chloroplastic-like n=1 Tax=Aegilops tauschii subsp. strangulata TaxID=200361 RepID=UPI00098A4689|nr:phospholipase A1-Igamma1, chloroplastic-like [Aegilops tauschii subsp. strangulata]
MSIAGRSLPAVFKRLLQLSVNSAAQPLTSSRPPPVNPHAKFARRGGWDAALLDPLDAGLRAEILRHGDLAQATYDAFDGRYWSPNCGTSLHGLRRMLPALGLAGHGYVATAFIYATCDVDIPRWLMTRLHADAWDDHANWAGYVAVAGAEEASRVGHRDVVVVWRGTMSAEEWFMNLRTGLVPFDAAAEGDGAMVAEGFHTLYTSSNAGNKYGARSARDQVADELKRLVDHFGKRGEEVHVTFTGHSLGGALALLSARDAAAAHPDVPVRAVTFSAPRVGNRAFSGGLTSRNVSVLRVVVKTDLVPTVPRTALEASVSGVLGGLWALAGLRQAFEYVHVGHELALNVSKSPHLKDSHDPVGSHNLELCLHLLDGHESAAGAFRREDGAPRRDVALVNKRSAMLRDTEGIPEKWCQTANKGLERNGSGRWVLPARERDDMPANDVLPLSELD